MPELALLNEDGTVHRKLAFTSLPPDFKVPEGMYVSWRESFVISSERALAQLATPPPSLAYAKYGSASAEITARWTKSGLADDRRIHYGIRDTRVTVQGRNSADVMILRDKILEMIRERQGWGTSIDFTPKTSMWTRIRRRIARVI